MCRNLLRFASRSIFAATIAVACVGCWEQLGRWIDAWLRWLCSVLQRATPTEIEEPPMVSGRRSIPTPTIHDDHANDAHIASHVAGFKVSARQVSNMLHVAPGVCTVVRPPGPTLLEGVSTPHCPPRLTTTTWHLASVALLAWCAPQARHRKRAQANPPPASDARYGPGVTPEQELDNCLADVNRALENLKELRAWLEAM